MQVASVFGLSSGDVPPAGWQQLSDALLVMLQQPSTYKPAVYLMMQFEARRVCVCAACSRAAMRCAVCLGQVMRCCGVVRHCMCCVVCVCVCGVCAGPG
jgi:hypothetical protein